MTYWGDAVVCVDLSQRRCRVHTCRKTLTGRRTAYCCDEHGTEFGRNHWWNAARWEALRRAGYVCQRCRAHQRFVEDLHVHHIAPLDGQSRGVSCLNHQENLVPLCAPCHRAVERDLAEKVLWGARMDRAFVTLAQRT